MSTDYCKCLKCEKVFDLYDIIRMERLGKWACLSCQSKNLEWSMLEEGGLKLNYITNECSTCKRPKVVDILNWEEIKAICIKRNIAESKPELIKKMNEGDEKNCYCVNLAEREREQKWI